MSAIPVSSMAAFDALCGVPIAAILFGMIRRTVRQIPPFVDKATVISACVTLVCMIGLYRTFVTPSRGKTVPTQDRRPWLEFVLLAYTVLALAMLLALLLRFGLRWKDRLGGRHRRSESVKRGGRLHPRDQGLRESQYRQLGRVGDGEWNAWPCRADKDGQIVRIAESSL